MGEAQVRSSLLLQTDNDDDEITTNWITQFKKAPSWWTLDDYKFSKKSVDGASLNRSSWHSMWEAFVQQWTFIG